MRKTSRIISIVLILSILISLIPVSISNADENTKNINSVYKDINEAIKNNECLDNKYSYGGLFWSEDTEIIDAGSQLANKETQMFIDEPVSAQVAESFPREMERKYVEGSYMVLANEGESIKLKITNCAIDEKGDLCDVILEIDNIQDYIQPGDVAGTEDARTYLSRIVIRKGYEVTNDNSNNSKHYDCNLINLSLYNVQACSDFKITYYKAGTNNLADINGVATTIYDFDVPNPYDGESYPEYGLDDNGKLIIPSEPNSEKYLDEVFQGNEGVVGLENTTYYYGKNDYLEECDNGISTPLGVGARLYEAKKYSEILEEAKKADNTDEYMLEFLEDREDRNVLSGTDGITTKTTCMLLQDQKAKFSMRYGGVGCGIFFVFVPLIPYEPSEPIKAVDVEETEIGKVFHYTATQYIANNYNTSKLQLAEDSNSILYEEVIMTDELNENLEIAETENDKIKILDTNDEDISNWFTISKENNTVTATVKEEKLNKEEFYNHTFKLIIPVKVKEGCTLNEIPNHVTTTFKQNGKTINKPSNEVTVKIKHKDPEPDPVKYDVTLTVEVINGVKDRKEEVKVSAGSNNEFVDILIKPNKGYKLESLVIDGKSVDVTKLTYNKDGSYTFSIKDENINKNIDHVVKAVCVKEEVPPVIPNAGATCGMVIAIVLIAGYAVTRYRKMKK